MSNENIVDFSGFVTVSGDDFNEIKKKAELYEKLRRMNPREFTELYRKNISSGMKFDELVERWPE